MLLFLPFFIKKHLFKRMTLVEIILFQPKNKKNLMQRCPQGRANLPCPGALSCPDTGQGEDFIYALPCKITGQGRTTGQGRAGRALHALEISQSSIFFN
jgi:hypothetical protein